MVSWQAQNNKAGGWEKYGADRTEQKTLKGMFEKYNIKQKAICCWMTKNEWHSKVFQWKCRGLEEEVRQSVLGLWNEYGRSACYSERYALGHWPHHLIVSQKTV